MKIVHLYPDLMNLYGDYASALLLQKRLDCAGYAADILPVTTGQPLPGEGWDLLLIGAGTEGAMLSALDDIRARRGELGGGKILLLGNALALLGAAVTDEAGAAHEGAALLNLSVAIDGKRRYAEYLMRCPLVSSPVTGSINTSLTVDSAEPPLFSVQYETAPLLDKSFEGVLTDKIFATQLTGPLLVRNPALLDYFAASLCPDALPPCDEAWYRYACKGYDALVRRLTREQEARR